MLNADAQTSHPSPSWLHVSAGWKARARSFGWASVYYLSAFLSVLLVSAALRALSGQTLAELLRSVKAGKAVQLTLCGERTAVTLETQDKPWWGRIQQRFSTASSQQLLQTL